MSVLLYLEQSIRLDAMSGFQCIQYELIEVETAVILDILVGTKT